MSWLSSLFTFPQPHDAKQLATPNAPLTSQDKHAFRQKRLLEESVDGPELDTNKNQQESVVKNATNRNKIIFGAGLSFFALSMMITRRAFTRRRVASQAAFYTNAPGHQAEQSTKISGAMESLEALNIATINVLSLAMIGVGGSLWYYDINSVDDARRFVRGGLGVDGSGRSEKEAEEDFEEWIASTLSRKEAKQARIAMQEERN